MTTATTLTRLAVAIVATTAIATGLTKLSDAESGLTISTVRIGDTPATIFKPQNANSAPVIVIAHGFAGSQQLMQPFAVTLARNGYTAVTFDFLGHGRNPVPMRGDITEGTGITSALLRELGEVSDYARKLPSSDGRLALLGHSMASDIVIRFAQAHPDVEATVAVSVFSPVATATTPRNLLVIVGSVEPAMLRDEGHRILGLSAGPGADERKTYGQFTDGGARRLVFARGVEHIGVLFSEDSMTESLAWMNAAFEHHSQGWIDSRGVALALLFSGIIALAWPLTSLLPQAANEVAGATISWKILILLGFFTALATPLVLWKLPTDFLPILLGDYLALHFAVYGVLTGIALFLLRRITANAPTQLKMSWRNIAIAAIAVAGYEIAAFGLPVDRYVFSFMPIASRVPMIAAVFCGAIVYFVSDEWLTRGASTKFGAYAFTKFTFLLSLAIAVLLNPQKLFFLAIIVPAIFLLFIAFGLISTWTYRQVKNPFPGAIANALIFAWAIAVTFPMVVR